MRSAAMIVGVVLLGLALPALAEPSPVLLVPGFAGWRDIEALGGPYFGPLKDALEEAGAEVYELAPPPVAGSDERGRLLGRAIDNVLWRTGAETVTIIAHSQGGLDVRVAMDLGYDDKIAAVLTLSAPHRGSDLADTALQLPRPLVRLALDTMSNVWESEQRMRVTTPDTRGALRTLSTNGAKRFNKKHKGTHGIPFFSMAAINGPDLDGSCQDGMWGPPRGKDILHPLMGISRTMLRMHSGDHISDDGVVPVKSTKFGTFLGCVPGDHVDWMGWHTGKPSVNHTRIIVEAWRGLRDVEQEGDEYAMDRRLSRLAKMATGELRDIEDPNEGLDDDNEDEAEVEAGAAAAPALAGDAPPAPELPAGEAGADVATSAAQTDPR